MWHFIKYNFGCLLYSSMIWLVGPIETDVGLPSLACKSPTIRQYCDQITMMDEIQLFLNPCLTRKHNEYVNS